MIGPGLFIQPTARKVFNWLDIVRDFGADPTTVRDSTTNIQAAINAAVAAGGGVVYIPEGRYLTTSSLVVNGDNIEIRGQGTGSQIRFHPPVADTALEIANGVNLVHRPVLIDFYMDATFAADVPKVGIALIDTTEAVVTRVQLNNFTDTTFASKGLLVKGRQLGSIGPMTITADYPVSIEDNPNSAIDIDHFHFFDMYLLGTLNQAAYTVASAVALSFVTLDGTQAWVLTKSGFVFVDAGSALSAPGLKICNARWEQEPATGGYMFDIQHNHALQNLIIENCYGGLNGNGYRLRKIQYASIRDNMYIGGAGKTGLDIDGTCINVNFINNFFQTGCTLTTAGFLEGFNINIDNAAGNRSRVALGGFPPAASSIMDLQSTTKGFLVPRMTAAQRNAIAAPAIGLLIFNTDTNVLNFWNGAWTPV